MSSAKNEYKQWNKANQLFFDKKYNEALKIYQKLESKHDLLEFKLQIARCYFYTNKKISALPWYEKVIEYPNINIEAYKEYAICLELKKRDAEALAYEKKYNELKKIQQVNKTNTPIIESFDATTNKEKVDKIKTKSNKEKLASINKKAVKDSLKVAKTVAEESIVTTKTTTSKSKKSKKNEAIEGLYYNIFLSSFLKDPGTSYYYDIEALGLFIKEKDGDNTLYYIGKYKDYETAEKYLQKIKEAGYENAYIQAYYNNKKVTLEKAQSLENNIE
ncbi:MAG: hypothetical protein H6553_02465 [Chitinophagales bacterium]|nr:hypothetical protein [Chitinophagales bacterium]